MLLPLSKLNEFEYESTRVSQKKQWQLLDNYWTTWTTIGQLHSTKPELRFCAGSNPARGVSEIRDGEDL